MGLVAVARRLRTTGLEVTDEAAHVNNSVDAFVVWHASAAGILREVAVSNLFTHNPPSGRAGGHGLVKHDWPRGSVERLLGLGVAPLQQPAKEGAPRPRVTRAATV